METLSQKELIAEVVDDIMALPYYERDLIFVAIRVIADEKIPAYELARVGARIGNLLREVAKVKYLNERVALTPEGQAALATDSLSEVNHA